MDDKLYQQLKTAEENKALPSVIAYNRIDGPGSSLDLREFQQAFWSMPRIPANPKAKPSMEWSRTLPRTIGITINTGTKIEAHPFHPDKIGINSIDYNHNIEGKPGLIPPLKEYWLLKIIELFGIVGVKFTLKNLFEYTHSSGLGGSSTATTGVCILANELANRPMDEIQLISLASRIEQDLGVSLTGTQEQSNVIFGGVVDYIWFPWGIPGRERTGYGESIRTELIPPEDYGELESRIAIFHTGKTRLSVDVNSVWREKLSTREGYALHKKKLEIAYQFREGLRTRDWTQVFNTIRDYRDIRITLCSDYIRGAEEISKIAENYNSIAFPLGAGGGGGVFIFSPDKANIQEIQKELNKKYQEIFFKIKSRGHELFNIPFG
ncbi:MAG: GHMP kinase [Promethearchaeota archaeon]